MSNETVAAVVAGIATIGAAVLSRDALSSARRRRKAIDELIDLRAKLQSPAQTPSRAKAPSPSGDSPGPTPLELVDRMLQRETAALDRLTDPEDRRRRVTVALLATAALVAAVVVVAKLVLAPGSPAYLVSSYIGAVFTLAAVARLMSGPWDWASARSHSRKGWWSSTWPLLLGVVGVIAVGAVGSLAVLGFLSNTPLYMGLAGK